MIIAIGLCCLALLCSALGIDESSSSDLLKEQKRTNQLLEKK